MEHECIEFQGVRLDLRDTGMEAKDCNFIPRGVSYKMSKEEKDCWLLIGGCWLLIGDCWLLIGGCWLLIGGCWLLFGGC